MNIKRWENFLLEYINFNKIKDISLEISHLVTYERMYVLRNVKNPKVYEIENDKLVETSETLFQQENLIKNYMAYFKNYDIQDSEIIKIEYKNYNWITIFICYSKNEKYAVVSYSPDLNEYDVVESIIDYLDVKNFHIIKNKLSVKKISNGFLVKLMKVFRDMSGRYYAPSILPEIKEEFDEFKDENEEEWKLYERWKYKNLGNNVRCIRYLDLPASFKLNLVDGSIKELKDLKINDLFYYPISDRSFSQWAERDTDIKTIKKDLTNILASGRFGVSCNVPTKQIILTNKLLLHNFSPHVNEREVIVEHDTTQKYDKNLICKMI